MNLTDFNYSLPEDLIAKHPPKIRGQSRLLYFDIKTKTTVDDQYQNLINYLKPTDLIIINDTKVIPARLKVYKKSNKAKRELILIEQHGQMDNWFQHKVIYKGKITAEDILISSNNIELKVIDVLPDGIAIIESPINLLDLADQIGEVPLPPYLKRQANKEDTNRYQTIWANKKGSVAAPTASLNMTNELLELIQQKATLAHLTLHVGLGTFLPIRSKKIEDHHMHQEYFEIPSETIKLIQRAKQNNQRIIAIGTTVARTLEYVSSTIMEHTNDQNLTGEADIFIYPGYNFKILDGLLTNFHAPKSTVLMLVSAFCGWNKLQKLYQHAIEEKYIFLSYGDSMFITKRP